MEIEFFYNKLINEKKIVKPFTYSFIHTEIKYCVLQSIDIKIKDNYLYINNEKFKIITHTGYCYKINKKNKTISTIDINFLIKELSNMANNINCGLSRSFFEKLKTITKPKTYSTVSYK